MRKLIILVLAAGLSLPAVMADAKRPLREVSEIDDALLYIAIADEIRKKCPTISGRLIKGLQDLQRLRRYAKDLGYTEAEIEAYVESKEEQARMEARGEAYVAARGADRTKPDTMCALGRAEIDRNSAIGVYLRAN